MHPAPPGGWPESAGAAGDRLCHHAISAEPPDPRHHAPVPDDVALALRLGLARHSDDRFQTADELGCAFAYAFASRPSPELRRRAHEVLRRHLFHDDAPLG